MMTPLISGYFLIYMVYRLGFIDEDEDALTMDISSQFSSDQLPKIVIGSFLENS